jgi:hypothetical protein
MDARRESAAPPRIQAMSPFPAIGEKIYIHRPYASDKPKADVPAGNYPQPRYRKRVWDRVGLGAFFGSVWQAAAFRKLKRS